jgi:hypothetical protein
MDHPYPRSQQANVWIKHAELEALTKNQAVHSAGEGDSDNRRNTPSTQRNINTSVGDPAVLYESGFQSPTVARRGDRESKKRCFTEFDPEPTLRTPNKVQALIEGDRNQQQHKDTESEFSPLRLFGGAEDEGLEHGDRMISFSTTTDSTIQDNHMDVSSPNRMDVS